MSADTPAIRLGSRVALHLEIALREDARVLSTFEAEPLELVLGDGTLVAGLEEFVIGLHAGADERFLVDGSSLYGPRDESKIHWLPRTDFPTDMELATGQVVAFDAPGGQEIAGLLLDLDGERVQVDFNHPLCGHPLQIRTRILTVADPED